MQNIARAVLFSEQRLFLGQSLISHRIMPYQ